MRPEEIRPARTFTVVGGDHLRDILMSNLERVQTVIREAHIAHEHGKTVNPHRVVLNFDKSPNRIIDLPVYVVTTAGAGVKCISSFPEILTSECPGHRQYSY